jgi:hypothetical protein
MASSKQKDGELDLNQGLRDVGIVVEYAVVADLADDAIEGVGVNMQSSSVLIKIATAPVIKEGEL